MKLYVKFISVYSGQNKKIFGSGNRFPAIAYIRPDDLHGLWRPIESNRHKNHIQSFLHCPRS